MYESIKRFKEGTKYLKIVSSVTSNELTTTNNITEDYMKKKCVKFIPASGAATRMFKDLYKYLEDQIETDYINEFFDGLERFAFYEDIKNFIKDSKIDKNTKDDKVKIIDYILNYGLNYGSLPKALIKMNSYKDFSKTPIDEHLYEGQKYLNSDSLNFHFTISKEHEELFKKYTEKIARNNKMNIEYSFQKKKTDTLAVDMDNNPFLLEGDSILYRPGGHGALIENLNDIDGDIIFIKNIDNICHRDYINDTIVSKKFLGSIGFEFKEKIDNYVKSILSNDYNLESIKDFISKELNISYKEEMTKEKALYFLNRPLRVCGVVKNQGEPGGGPFLVDNGEYTDLQICEKTEIDLNNNNQMEKLKNSDFFNPVDIVCFVKDYKGDKYNLLEYINKERYFISEKTYKGKDIKALEHPGLWNGAMSNWNTLFVEVPLTTFNPVKRVNDLLRDCRRSRI